jgi:phosphopentomutase
VLVVLDSVGAGALPDAARFGDAGASTLAHVAAWRPLRLPCLGSMGLGDLVPLAGVPPRPAGSGEGWAGRLGATTLAKDTLSGHWEMMGLVLAEPFRTFPRGLPEPLLQSLSRAFGVPILGGGRPASGTEVIARLGEEHLRTGYPIVYTSADSVLQIAAHESRVPADRLAAWGEEARRLATGRYKVGRVILRPFTGRPGEFRRTERRRDLALPPEGETFLDRLAARDVPVIGVGKIGDIFSGRGIATRLHAADDADGMRQTVDALRHLGRRSGLVFTNLVGFDQEYGHRRDVAGYAAALERADAWLAECRSVLRPADLLLVTADHGNDPTFRGTDHTREWVPFLAWRRGGGAGALGDHEGLGCVAHALAAFFGVPWQGPGRQILPPSLVAA